MPQLLPAVHGEDAVVAPGGAVEGHSLAHPFPPGADRGVVRPGYEESAAAHLETFPCLLTALEAALHLRHDHLLQVLAGAERCKRTPLQTSPATRSMAGPTAARVTGTRPRPLAARLEVGRHEREAVVLPS